MHASSPTPRPSAAPRRVLALLVTLAALLPLDAAAAVPAPPDLSRSALARTALSRSALARTAGSLDDDPRDHGAELFEGRAFDTCHTPSAGTMRAWRGSPYGAVGVYYAGRSRYCRNQPNLTRGWMRQVHAQGWRVLPLYVGSQAPCLRDDKPRVRLGAHPAATGRREARDAVARGEALGLVQRSAVYLDVEAFDTADAACARTTLSYVRAWSAEMRRLGWFPGLYSTASAGVRLVERARREGLGRLPSAVWFARWHTRGSVAGEPELAPGAWTPHRRLHQYAGDVTESHGGVAMPIDRSVVDAPVGITG